ncbi:MAG: AMP-binding protein [Chloroflexota bacterium]
MNGPIFGTASAAVAWRPSAEYLERSRLRRFMADTGSADLEALQARAVLDPAWFWEAATRDVGARFDPPPRSVLDTSRGIEWARWFDGAGFNYVRMAVDEPALAHPAEMALTWEGEDGEVRHFTRSQLRWAVDRAARAMAALGVARGDRVGIFLPMIPEAAIAVLAAGKLGAVYTPIFSGYGAAAAGWSTAARSCSSLPTGSGGAAGRWP